MSIHVPDAAPAIEEMPEAPMAVFAQPRFSVLRSLKLGTFQLRSSLVDLLSAAVWNRILISDLGVAALPVALLSALRYLLAPPTLWAGYRSDTRPLFGSCRVAYIWIERLLMLVSLARLPLATAVIAHHGFASGLGTNTRFLRALWCWPTDLGSTIPGVGP